MRLSYAGGVKRSVKSFNVFSEEPKDKADAMAGLDGSRRTVLASAAGMKRSCIFTGLRGGKVFR